MNLERARGLRRKMTDTERFAGYKFRRQMPLGPYIVDFVCLESRLILELDGGQHVERAEYDQKRTTWLESQGFEVLRFWDHEVLQEWDAVEEVIWRRFEERPERAKGRGLPGCVRPGHIFSRIRRAERKAGSRPGRRSCTP